MGIINYVSYMAHGPHDIDVLSGHHMSYCVVIWPLWWTTTPVLDASAMSSPGVAKQTVKLKPRAKKRIFSYSPKHIP